jgi:hypothetical protein
MLETVGLMPIQGAMAILPARNSPPSPIRHLLQYVNPFLDLAAADDITGYVGLRRRQRQHPCLDPMKCQFDLHLTASASILSVVSKDRRKRRPAKRKLM